MNDDITKDDLSDLGSYLESEANVEIGNIPVDSDEAGYTIDGIEAYSPSEKTVANVIDNVPPHAMEEADRIVEDADNAGDIVRELKTLIEETDAASHSIDDVVAKANGTTELREGVASRSDKVRTISTQGIEEVKTTLKESDPQEVGEFTLHATQAAAPAIKYAGRTNLALLSVLAISAAAGARKSSDQPSLFDDIDPQELSNAANVMALHGAEIHDDEVKGEAIGAILGMSGYAVRSMAPEEYAHWVTQADPEAIMRGAEQAAMLSSGSEDGSISGSTRLAGGMLGLFASYSDSVDTEDQDLFEALEAGDK